MKKNIFSISFFIIIIFVLMIILTSEVFALEVNWPASPVGTDLTDTSTLPELVKYLYEWGIFLGGLAFFIALLIAGMQYLTSVGKPELIKEAKNRITSAFLGLILLLGSWLILNTINPQLTTFHNPTFGGSASSTEDLNVSLKGDRSCVRGYYFPQKDYKGTPIVLVPGPPYTASTLGVNVIHGSVKSYIPLGPGEICEESKIDSITVTPAGWTCEKGFCTCKPAGVGCYCEGGCTLKLFLKTDLWGGRCKDLRGEIYANDSYIGRRQDVEIKCIMLEQQNK